VRQGLVGVLLVAGAGLLRSLNPTDTYSLPLPVPGNLSCKFQQTALSYLLGANLPNAK
jgi:hypothetical protein